MNVAPGQVWEVNRALRITFNRDVDFSSVNFNTVSLRDHSGFVATGVFRQDPSAMETIVFQPTCPTREDFSDAGLQPGTSYRLTVRSGSTGTSVRATDGAPLEFGSVVEFQTPNSTDPAIVFLDTVAGPPTALMLPVQPLAGEVIDESIPSSYVEIGGVRRYFGRHTASQEGRLEAGLHLPLNHYSVPENQLRFVIHLNQPIDSTPENLARARLEYLNASLGWLDFPSQVTVLDNCGEGGARLEVRPLGILPQGTSMRAVLDLGFADIAGNGTEAVSDRFAMITTQEVGDLHPIFPGVRNAGADEFLEGFEFAADEAGSWEDTEAVFPVPSANWGDGALQSNFGFEGTGGPNGDFDWHIKPATTVILNTTADAITGGPDGAETLTVPVLNGVIDVRDLRIPASSQLIIVGPNPCTIFASREVRILGEISVRGSDNPGVGSLNTTNQPESGSLGNAGGGSGGDGSPLSGASSPRGQNGNGPFNSPGQGGQGGECAYRAGGPTLRRGGGGGGGVLGKDVRTDHDGDPETPPVRCQILVGLDAEYGNAGSPEALGAVSQFERPQGGDMGPSPFLDEFQDNDFFGSKLTTNGQLVRGELSEVIAGSGGGGGGDSSNTATFPADPFDPTGDQKGAGGGGGGGGLRILAIGPIIIGTTDVPGSINLDGGHGGAGENTLSGGFLRIGGGSGGGSGGHLILSSAASITVHGRAETGDPWYSDSTHLRHSTRVISAVGGQGGAGKNNFGGAKEDGPRRWSCDRIPLPFFEGHEDVRPLGDGCFDFLPDIDDPEGPVDAAGGDGGPGLIQLHVDDLNNIHFPEIEAEFGGTYATGLDVSFAMAPPPEGWKAPGEVPDQMIPFFGRLSIAQTEWIPLGLARIGSGGTPQTVTFHGQAGMLPHGGLGTALLEDPILGPQTVDDATYEVTLDASGLLAADERYTENPALLRHASLRFSDPSGSVPDELYPVVSAEYDLGLDELTLHVDPTVSNPRDYPSAADPLVSLIPHTTRIITDGILDTYPDETGITLTYDATVWDSQLRRPSETLSLSETTGDWADSIAPLNGATWDFIRVRSTFDLDVNQSGVNLDTQRPALDHLRVQFEF